MANCISKYKKALKKNLRCTRNIQKQLLKKFEITWSTFLEDNPTPSMDELCTAFGSPKEMASVLMEEVTPEEIARYRRRKVLLWGAFGCVLALVLTTRLLLMTRSSLTTRLSLKMRLSSKTDYKLRSKYERCFL